MYKAPNGMIFESYAASMEYNQRMINKEMDNFKKSSKMLEGICPKCGRKCDKLSLIYLCRACGEVLMESEYESES